MNRITEGKKYCYRYHDGNDSEGRPIVTLWKRVIIRETDKTFWHVEDMPYMTNEQLIKYRTGGQPANQKYHVKRCLKGADRSSYHYTREEALQAFVRRKTHQISKIRSQKKQRACVLPVFVKPGSFPRDIAVRSKNCRIAIYSSLPTSRGQLHQNITGENTDG